MLAWNPKDRKCYYLCGSTLNPKFIGECRPGLKVGRACHNGEEKPIRKLEIRISVGDFSSKVTTAS